MSLLAGITVLDLSRVVAGPACTRTLADLGAEVLKIEPPNGDLMRRGVPRRGGIAIGYAQQNAGKRHLSIDLTQPAGRQLVQRLATHCDVLVENYRPGVAARLGLGYPEVHALNPRLVYCSISGYGQTGRAAQRRAYAPIIHAELGLIELNARERGTAPLPEAVSHADFAASAQATAGILAALLSRERTGEGQHIDVSMAETMLAMNEWTAVEANGGIAGEISIFRPGKAALLRTADGAWVQLPGNPTTSVFAIARALGREQALADRGWQDFADTQDKIAEVHALLQTWAAEFATAAAFEAALERARMPLGQVRSLADVALQPWALEREAFVEVDLGGTPVKLPRSPFRFSGHAVGPKAPPARRGADNAAVLSEKLGLDAREIERLEAEGILSSEVDDA